MWNEKLEKIAIFYSRRKQLKTLLARMATHVSNCKLEPLIRFNKMDKIQKMHELINVVGDIPYCTLQLFMSYLEYFWDKMVRENGFININETIRQLRLNIDIDKLKCGYGGQTMMTIADMKTNYMYNICPVNCVIEQKNNDNCVLNICAVRPAFTELDGKLYGLCVEINQRLYTLRIFGLLDRDNSFIYRKELYLSLLYDDLKQKYNFDKDEIEPFVNCISYRDFISIDIRNLTNRVKILKDRYTFYENSDIETIMGEYLFLTDSMKVEKVNYLFSVGLDTIANYLYGKKPFHEDYLDWRNQKKITIYKCPSPTKQKVPFVEPTYEERIHSMTVDERIKGKASEKLKILRGSSESAPKAQKYLDGILKIPFNKIKSESDLNDPGKDLYKQFHGKFPDIDVSKYGANYMKLFEDHMDIDETRNFCIDAHFKMQCARDKQQEYLDKVQDIFENCVHGHDLVKIQLRRLLAQWISGGQSGIVLGLEGPPGNGKTTLIKNGLAKCLIDENNKPRPVGFIPLGGSTNASSLIGHGFTYVGSNWGRIVDILMETECMNPIFLFDELDKVSKTEHGTEIISILTHLTDSTQNNEFFDKYFEGIPLDLSKALMVFTFNDRNKIDPILLDRMTVIETKPLSLDDKMVVAKKHLIPQISKLVDFIPSEIYITDDEIETLICDYTCEAGARQLKKLLESLLQELNLRRLMDPNTDLRIDHFLINDVFKHRDKVRRESISDKPLIGQINGMWANSLGMGGILPIQVDKTYTSKNLVLTGTQGDTMKESMRCAETIAINLTCKEYPEFNREDLKYGLHIHCPSTGMPKDGPSAGGAICIAIFSFLTNRYIKQEIAMTGEIDLMGRILAIGGLEAKLNGAKKAGIKKALIPLENKEQYVRLMREGKCPEDDKFEIVMVDTIYEAYAHFFEKN